MCERQSPGPEQHLPLLKAQCFLLVGSVTSPAALPHQGLFSPKASIIFGYSTRGYAELDGRICLPQTRAKFMDMAKAGPRAGGELSLHAELVFLTAPTRVTKLECVPPKGCCYGDFINNITFRMRVL